MDNLETLSEKRKPGRPRVLRPEYERLSRSIWGNDLSLKTHQNRAYGSRAIQVLGIHDEPPSADVLLRYAFLCDPEGQQAGKPRTHKHVILAELGRIDDDDDLIALAGIICDRRL